MNMTLKDRLAALAAGPADKKDKVELGKNLLAAKFLSEIQLQLDEQGLTRKSFAKKMGVSQSFISQLFTADKTVSIEFLAKAQEELEIIFGISAEKKRAEASMDAEMNKVIEIEKNNPSREDSEEGFWIYYSKEPNYQEQEPYSETKEISLSIAS